MSTPLHIISQHSKSDDWLFAPDAEEGTEAIRDLCASSVLEDEVFYQYGELPQRMQQSLMNALRNGDTEANDREIGRIIRAAYERALNDAVEMYVDRIRDEAGMDIEHD